MSGEDEAVRMAVARLYERFARFPPPEEMQAAPSRDIGAIMGNLKSAPLRQLSAEALDGYAIWAMTTVGEPADYMHFLPRIVELATIEGGYPGLSPETIASKLDYGSWRSLGTDLCTAIEDVFHAAWVRGRLQHPDEEDSSGWLWGMVGLGIAIGPELDGWLDHQSRNSMAQLAWFTMLSKSLFEDLECGLGAPLDVRRQVADWILSKPVETALTAAAAKGADRDLWMFESAEASRSILRGTLGLH